MPTALHGSCPCGGGGHRESKCGTSLTVERCGTTDHVVSSRRCAAGHQPRSRSGGAGWSVRMQSLLRALCQGCEAFTEIVTDAPDPAAEEPSLRRGRRIPRPDVVDRLATGSVNLPSFSIDFPVEHLQTELEWRDVVLPPKTWHQIREIES